MKTQIQNIEDFARFINSNKGRKVNMFCHANGKAYHSKLSGATNTGFSFDGRFINFPKADYINFNTDNSVTFFCLPDYSMILSTTKPKPSLTLTFD